MIAVIACLLCLTQELRRIERTEPAAPPLPAGNELRLHDASAVTGHAELARTLAELGATSRPMQDAAAAEELARLAELRRAAEETAEGIALTMGARLALAEGQELRHLGEGRLALLAPPVQHERLDVALTQSAGFQGRLRVQTRLFLGPTVELPAEALGSGLVLAEPRAAELALAIQQSSREALSAPVVEVDPWREAHLSALDQVPYVKDYTLTRVPDLDLEIADPEIAVLELGFELSVRSAPAGPGRVAVQVDLTHRRLAEPLRDFETTLPGFPSPVTIQLASVLTVGLEGSFEIAESETLLLARGEGAERVAMLLTARRVAR